MSDHKPRVCIGLPVFNGERYLTLAINSILSQTYTDFELIISDNASTDGTQQICQEFVKKDSRVHYFRNEKNLGAAPNFIKVFKLSSSEYFKWAAFDDLIAPTFIERCVEILDYNPAVILCYSRVRIIDENGDYVDDYNPGPDTNSPRAQIRFRNLILHPEYAVQQMGVIRSNVLGKTILHRSFPSSDEVLLAQLSLLGEFYEIPDRIFFYRIFAQQSTQRMPTQRERTTFFDTTLIGKIVLPKWQYFFACIKVITNAPLRWSARISCYLTMVRWLLVPAHFRAMLKDVLLALHKSTIRALSRTRTSISNFF